MSCETMRQQPLQNRRSNPIITFEEEDDDDDDKNNSIESINGHLKSDGGSSVIALNTAGTDGRKDASGLQGSFTTASTCESTITSAVTNSGSTLVNSAVESAVESGSKSNLESGSKSAMESSLEPNSEPSFKSNLESNLEPSLESSLKSSLESILKSSLESNLKSNSKSNESDSRSNGFCISPEEMSPNRAALRRSHTDPFLASSPRTAPTGAPTGSPSEAPLDFDATLHRRRGKGILASHGDLKAPPERFAAGCILLQLCAIGELAAVQGYIEGVFGDVNFRDYDRRTALHVASSEGHLDVVRFLVRRGCKVNRSDRWGGSPLDDAHRHRHEDVARYLRSRGATTGSVSLASNLIAAAAAGDIEEVKLLLMSGDNLDWSAEETRPVSPKKNTVAGVVGGMVYNLNSSTSKATAGRAALDVSEPSALQSEMVDINKGDYDQRTALHLAASEGHVDVVEFLCRRGADVNIQDRWGGRPLDDALQKANDKCARILRRYGATEAAANNVDLNLMHTSVRNLASLAPTHDSSDGEDENLHVDFHELEMIERIGSGAFGEIYKCRWRGILVAAKCIKASKIQREWLLKNRSSGIDSSSERRLARLDAAHQASITEEEKHLALEDFRRETAIMRRLRHPNIVMMLGYSNSSDVEVMISELMRCSLLDIFKANHISNSQLPKRTQIVYAQQLAQGMNHLHKSRPPIIHRDLKPANLLIDFSGTLKIADFGLAKIRPNPEQCEVEAFMMTGETGSYRFMAPEVFRHEEYTQTVDVYSYAMIFYYMLRGIPPWSGLSGVDAATKAAVDGKRPIIPRDVDVRLSTLLKRCWDERPTARPSFEEIITFLNGYSHDVFKTNDKEVNLALPDTKCGCIIS